MSLSSDEDEAFHLSNVCVSDVVTGRCAAYRLADYLLSSWQFVAAFLTIPFVVVVVGGGVDVNLVTIVVDRTTASDSDDANS